MNKFILKSFFLTLIIASTSGLSQNLLTNGNFQSGGSGNGFLVDGSGYTLLTSPYSGTTASGNYAFVTNSQVLNTTSFASNVDHTSGTGNMMVVDGNGTGGNQRFWKAGSTGNGVSGLTVGKRYTFSFYAKSIYNTGIAGSSPADIRVDFTNASAVTPVVNNTVLNAPVSAWQKIAFTFTATNANVFIELSNNNTTFPGNDFAVDDFSLVGALDGTSSFQNFSCNGANNGSIVAYGIGGIAPYTFSIAGPTALPSNSTGVFPNLGVGSYTVTITDATLATFVLPAISITQPAIVPPIVTSPNTVISPGTSTSLSATGGSGTYTWTAVPADPSLTTPTNANVVVSPTVTTNYTVSGTPTPRNLIFNGDFTANNVGFTSDASYLNPTNPTNQNDTYGVVSNSNAWSSTLSNCTAHDVGGKMLVYRGQVQNANVWCQKVVVTPNTNYNLDFWVQNLLGASANISVSINGTSIYSTTSPATTCTWAQKSTTWNSGVATVATICIQNASPAGLSRNFAIDDVTFTTLATCVTPKTVNVSIAPSTTPVDGVYVNISSSNPVCDENACTDLTATYPDLFDTGAYSVASRAYTSYPYNGGTLLPATNSAGTNNDDFWSTTILSPFKFCFFGNPYTNFIIGTNGVISFEQSIPTQTPDGFCQWSIGASVPSAALPRNSIFGVFQDIHYANRPPTSYINYYVLGSSPNRAFITNYFEIPQYPSQVSNLQTYQMVMHETTNIIEVNVQRRVPNNGWQGGVGIIGLQNATGTAPSLAAPGRNTGNWTANNESWVFTPSTVPATPLVSFHWENAANPGVSLGTTNPLTVCIPDRTQPQTFIAVVEYGSSCSTDVVRVTNSYTVNVEAPLPVSDPENICYSGALPANINIDQETNVLTAPQIGNYDLSYYDGAFASATTDAANGGGPSYIINPLAFNVTSLPRTIYVRIEDVGFGTGCFNVRSFVIQPASSGTFSYVGSPYCNSDATHSPTLSSLTPGGDFTSTAGLNINITTGVITAGSTNGIYTVNYDIAATATCPAYNTSTTVEIISCGCPVVTTNTGPICLSSTVDLSVTAATLVPSATYTWSGPGIITPVGSANPLVTVTPPAAGSSVVYTLTIASPTVNCNVTSTVVVNTPPNAGTPIAVMPTVCESSTTAISLASLLTGEDTGGVWTRTTGTGGTFTAGTGMFTPTVGATTSTFTYTVNGVLPCTPDSEVVTVNIVAGPKAGTLDATQPTAFCDDAATVITLANYLTGEDAGGTWAMTSATTGGTFNAGAGTFTVGNVTANSTYTFTYTAIGTAPCANVVSPTITITVNNAPNAGTPIAVMPTVCESSTTAISLASLLTGEDTGGVWTRTTGTGGTFTAGTGTFTPTVGATTSTFTYTMPANGACISVSKTVTVTINKTVTAGTAIPSPTYCENSTDIINLYDLLTGEDAGGNWTRINGTGGNFTMATGTFAILGGATTSTFRYSINGTAPCPNDFEEVTIIITPAVTPNFANPGPICQDTEISTINLPNVSTNGVVGTWSPAINNQQTTTYTFTPSATSCAFSTTMTIVVNPRPVVTLDQDLYFCVDAAGMVIAPANIATGLSPALYNFLWYNDTILPGTLISGETGSSLNVSVIGTYRVEVENKTTLCSKNASTIVVSSLAPVSMSLITSTYFADDAQITVSVLPVGNYEYQIDNGVFQSNNSFHNLNPGNHTVAVRDKFGCGTVTGEVRLFDYPKFFTPNGDNYNDTWNISDLQDEQPNAKILIFDRYGKFLKQIIPGIEGWNGTFNGNDLIADDYWFTIEYTEQGINKIFKSHFALKR